VRRRFQGPDADVAGGLSGAPAALLKGSLDRFGHVLDGDDHADDHEHQAQGSFKPVGAEVIRQVGGWGGAFVGAKVGFAVGAMFGIETGPGAIITGAIGAVVFGALGYFGADLIADRISPN
jgi:hypothetical protein